MNGHNFFKCVKHECSGGAVPYGTYMVCLVLTVMLIVMTAVSTPVYSSTANQQEDGKTSSFHMSGTIWIAGDSIAADHSYEKEEDYAVFVHGWGEMIGSYLTDDVIVHNKAISGQTAKFFTEEQNYQDIMDGIGEGDLLLIQFGHNDYKSAGSDHWKLGTDVEGSYRWYLKNKYIDPALKAGAMPVLCSSVVLCRTDNGTVTEGQAQSLFAESMRTLYEEYCEQGIEIGWIDTYSLTQTLLNADSNAVTSYYAVKYDRSGGGSTSLDRVHFSEKGARAAADIIAQNLFVMYEDFNRFNPREIVDGGSGTREDPYRIGTWAQLYRIMQTEEYNQPQLCYKLTQDLMPAIQQQEWETAFYAELDGDGHVLRNPAGSSLGAFADQNYGTIHDLKLVYNLRHTLKEMQVPFVRENYGTIRGCKASGMAEYSYFPEGDEELWLCGVFAGRNHKGAVIEDCTNHAAVTTFTNVPKVYLGGMAGYNEGTIRQCTNTGAMCIDSFEYDSKNPPTYPQVVCCGGGITGVLADEAVMENCIGEQEPKCVTTLKSKASVLRREKTAAITAGELAKLLEEQGEPEQPEPEVKKGDLDQNGKVQLDDAQLALKFALKINVPEDWQIKAGDVDENGKIELNDAQDILKAALHIINLPE